MPVALDIEQEFEKLKDITQAKKNERFFKMADGEYASHETFLGINVPTIRELVKKYWAELKFKDLDLFLNSKYHEKRLFALLVLVRQYKSKRFSDDKKREAIYEYYLENSYRINNWDLVDVTAPHIIGAHLLNNQNRTILYTLVKSDSLWERRISIVSTFTFINNLQFKDTLVLSKILLDDKEDLIHKAVGWAIRNVGIKDETLMCRFLNEYYKQMPRTMLRYAIEKLDEPLRQKYLKGKV